MSRPSMPRLVWLEWIILAILSVLVLIVFANVVGRFVFANAITWADEVARFLFIWLTFLGATLGVARGSHIGMDLVVQMVGPRTRRLFRIVSSISVLVFLGAWGTFGWRLVRANLDYLAPATGVPMGWVYVVGPASAVLMALLYLRQLWIDIRYAEAAED